MENNNEVKLDHIKNKLVVMSGKGGVGKSTVAVNLAVSLAKKGCNVGLLDVDVHGPSVPKLLGLEGSKIQASPDGMILPVMYNENLKVLSMGFLIEREDSAVIWRGPMKYNAIKQFLSDVDWGNVDYLIIDSPPGTGDEPLAVCQLLGENAKAIIVTTPQDVALSDVYKSVTFCEKVGIEIEGIIENMSGLLCPHCGEMIDLLKKGGGERLAKETSNNFLGAIPIDPEIVQGGDNGQPIMGSNVLSEKPSFKAFDLIIEKIKK